MSLTPRKQPVPNGPKWWQLYLIVGAVVGMGLLETQLPISETVHRVIEVGLVLGLYGLASGWLTANETALLRASMPQRRMTIERRTVIEPKPIEPAPADGDKAPTPNATVHADITYRRPGVAGRLHHAVSAGRRRRNRKMLS